MASKSSRVYTGAIMVLTIAAVGTLNGPTSAGANGLGGPRWYDPYRNRSTVTIPGTIWDFYKRNSREMDPDFDGHEPKHGRGQYVDIMGHTLDPMGKPMFSGGGYLVEANWQNEDRQSIIWPKAYIATWPGDCAGRSPRKVSHDHGDAVTNEEDVGNWWRDMEGVNESYQAPITFVLGAPDRSDPPKGKKKMPAYAGGVPGVYAFDAYVPRATRKELGLKPGQDEMADLIAKGRENKRRYTYEGSTTFIYEKDAGWWLRVEAQDDAWVYIDGKLVVDLGGAYKHAEKREYCNQTIELDRLGWLQDGGTYSIKIFVADRDKGSERSNLRMRTTIETLGLVGPIVTPPSMQQY